jgi:hypothetical protein
MGIGCEAKENSGHSLNLLYRTVVVLDSIKQDTLLFVYLFSYVSRSSRLVLFHSGVDLVTYCSQLFTESIFFQLWETQASFEQVA